MSQPTELEIKRKMKAVRDELEAIARKHNVDLVVDVVDNESRVGMSCPLTAKPLPGSEADVILELALKTIEAGNRFVENGSATIRASFKGVDDPKRVQLA